MRITASRYHDFSCGHRVCGHESKCAHLHGHNYRVHFTVASAGLDEIGRVIDFSAIKERLCEWVEQSWDHKFLVFYEDPWARMLADIDPAGVVQLPFNPTAENMAAFLLNVIGPRFLPPDIILTDVRIEETRKCAASAAL